MPEKKEVDIDALSDKARSITDKLDQKLRWQREMTPALLEQELQERAQKFADEKLMNATAGHVALINEAMRIGWEIGVRRSIEYMQQKGVTLGG